MNKNLLIIVFSIFLNGCATSGSALLGPIFTGAKTGSIYQASISYSTGRMMNELIPSEIFFQNNIEAHDPMIISNYKVENIIFSEVVEEEPLP